MSYLGIVSNNGREFVVGGDGICVRKVVHSSNMTSFDFSRNIDVNFDLYFQIPVESTLGILISIGGDGVIESPAGLTMGTGSIVGCAWFGDESLVSASIGGTNIGGEPNSLGVPYNEVDLNWCVEKVRAQLLLTGEGTTRKADLYLNGSSIGSLDLSSWVQNGTGIGVYCIDAAGEHASYHSSASSFGYTQ